MLVRRKRLNTLTLKGRDGRGQSVIEGNVMKVERKWIFAALLLGASAFMYVSVFFALT